MTIGAIMAAILGLAALAFVVAPLLRRESAPAVREAAAASEARDLQAQREMLLAALRDLEDDHATDKVSEEDYAGLKQRLTARAVDVMKRLDEAKSAAAEELTRPVLRPVPNGRED